MEALIVISLVTLVIGVLLYIPARLLAKRLLRKSAPSDAVRLRVTSAGLAVATLLVGLLVFGVAQPRIAPESALGRLLGSGAGAALYFGGVTLLASVLSTVLELLGFTLFHRDTRDGR